MLGNLPMSEILILVCIAQINRSQKPSQYWVVGRFQEVKPKSVVL